MVEFGHHRKKLACTFYELFSLLVYATTGVCGQLVGNNAWVDGNPFGNKIARLQGVCSGRLDTTGMNGVREQPLWLSYANAVSPITWSITPGRRGKCASCTWPA